MVELNEETLQVLIEAGFQKNRETNLWEGQLVSCGKVLQATIDVPEEFPYELPVFSLVSPSQALRRAHIEKSGKVCIAQNSGTSLDLDRPEAILRDCFTRAHEVLNQSEDDEQAHLINEIMAYWPDEVAKVSILSMLADIGHGECFQTTFDLNGNERSLVSQTQTEGLAFIKHLHLKPNKAYPCYRLGLASSISPPPFSKSLSLRALLNTIQPLIDRNHFQDYLNWLERTPDSSTLIIQFVHADEFVTIGVEILTLSGKLLERAQSGFRPGLVPTNRIFNVRMDQKILRTNVEAVDRNSLIYRAQGSQTDLGRILLIGCGSVGSFIAEALCLKGVREVIIVDREKLGVENTHRHLLGMSNVGVPKAEGVAKALLKRFPQIDIQYHLLDIFDWLAENEDAVENLDLAIVALGDETSERRLNSILFSNIDRAHAWVEALDLGGHVVYLKKQSAPCFECLYSREASGLLYNMAMIASPNQNLRKTYRGCAGTYLPFGSRSAQAIALECVALISACKGKERSAITTRKLDGSEFESLGFQMTKRGQSLRRGESVTVEGYDFRKADCAVCSGD